MTLKASRLPVLAGVLCLLLVGFAGVSYGAVRFDVVPSPTEVINTGRSEVLGSVNLIVRGTGNVTGTAAGGFTQIGLIYTNPAMQIDNDNDPYTGIKLIFSTGFAAANPVIFEVANRDINGQLSGFITINLEYGVSVAEGEFLRVEGVRGRIYDSLARTPGTDLYVDMQSINDPSANSFTPDRVRVAKSLDGMGVEIEDDSLLLCFPTLGRISGTPENYIDIYEGFARAFVDNDANNDGDYTHDRVDSEGDPIGAPTVATHFYVWLEGIPASVDDVSWADSSTFSMGGNYSFLDLVDYDFDSTTGTAYGIYQYQTTNQTDASDVTYEYFRVKPIIELKSSTQTATGQVYAAVTLYPNSSGRPRFFKMFESDRVATNNPPDDPPKLYASVIRCNCFLLFTYVTVDNAFNTGFAIANTTGDTAVFGINEAPDQLGKITFYFYDKAQGYVGSTTTTDDILAGKTFTGLVSQLLPSGVTTFSGYVIAKAEFQFCHGLAFIADQGFASVMHGYIANVIPDPAIRNMGGRRAPVAAGDSAMIPAGESLNN